MAPEVRDFCCVEIEIVTQKEISEVEKREEIARREAVNAAAEQEITSAA